MLAAASHVWAQDTPLLDQLREEKARVRERKQMIEENQREFDAKWKAMTPQEQAQYQARTDEENWKYLARDAPNETEMRRLMCQYVTERQATEDSITVEMKKYSLYKEELKRLKNKYCGTAPQTQTTPQMQETPRQQQDRFLVTEAASSAPKCGDPAVLRIIQQMALEDALGAAGENSDSSQPMAFNLNISTQSAGKTAYSCKATIEGMGEVTYKTQLIDGQAYVTDYQYNQ